MHRTVNSFMVLGMGGRGAAGLRILRNAKDCHHFRGFESARDGCGWLQNHKKCIGLSSFAWFWKWAGGGRLGSESKEMHRPVSIFMVLEAGGKRAAGRRIIRNAKDSYHGCGSVRERSGWPRNHKKCMECNAFSWFWKRAGGGAWAQNHAKCIGQLSFSCLWKWKGEGRVASES